MPGCFWNRIAVPDWLFHLTQIVFFLPSFDVSAIQGMHLYGSSPLEYLTLSSFFPSFFPFKHTLSGSSADLCQLITEFWKLSLSGIDPSLIFKAVKFVLDFDYR